MRSATGRVRLTGDRAVKVAGVFAAGFPADRSLGQHRVAGIRAQDTPRDADRLPNGNTLIVEEEGPSGVSEFDSNLPDPALGRFSVPVMLKDCLTATPSLPITKPW